MDRREELQAINRAARALVELIARRPEYEALYTDLRIAIEKNEQEIFELLKEEYNGKERETRSGLLFI